MSAITECKTCGRRATIRRYKIGGLSTVMVHAPHCPERIRKVLARHGEKAKR